MFIFFYQRRTCFVLRQFSLSLWTKKMNNESFKYRMMRRRYQWSYFRFSVSMHSMIAFRQVCQSPLSYIHLVCVCVCVCECYLSFFQVNAFANRTFFYVSLLTKMMWNRTIVICKTHFLSSFFRICDCLIFNTSLELPERSLSLSHSHTHTISNSISIFVLRQFSIY